MSDNEGTKAGAGMPRWMYWPLAGFAIIGIIGTLVIAAILVSFLPFSSPAPQPEVAAKQGGPVFAIEDVGEVSGTSLIRMSIAASPRSGGSYSGGNSDVRNIILFDKTNGKSRKLLANNDRRIEDISFFSVQGAGEDTGGDFDHSPPNEDRSSPVAYYVVEVDQPSGGLKDVLIGTLANGRQGYVMRGVDGILRMWMLDQSHIGMIVRQQKSLYHRVVDIPALRVTQSVPIEID